MHRERSGPIAYMATNGVAANLLMWGIIAAGVVSFTGLEHGRRRRLARAVHLPATAEPGFLANTSGSSAGSGNPIGPPLRDRGVSDVPVGVREVAIRLNGIDTELGPGGSQIILSQPSRLDCPDRDWSACRAGHMKTERSYNSGSETPAARHTSANVPNRHLDEVADLGVLVPIIDQSHQTTFVVSRVRT